MVPASLVARVVYSAIVEERRKEIEAELIAEMKQACSDKDSELQWWRAKARRLSAGLLRKMPEPEPQDYIEVPF